MTWIDSNTRNWLESATEEPRCLVRKEAIGRLGYHWQFKSRSGAAPTLAEAKLAATEARRAYIDAIWARFPI